MLLYLTGLKTFFSVEYLDTLLITTNKSYLLASIANSEGEVMLRLRQSGVLRLEPLHKLSKKLGFGLGLGLERRARNIKTCLLVCPSGLSCHCLAGRLASLQCIATSHSSSANRNCELLIV